MRYANLKSRRGCELLPWLLIAMSLLLPRPARAAVADTRALTLNAGEQQIIDNLDPASKPALKVIDNPHALVVHDEAPGKLVLLGAEAGTWEISVKLKDGQTVTYRVAVHAIRDASAPLEPGTAPVTTADESRTGAARSMPIDSDTASLATKSTTAVVASAPASADVAGSPAPSAPPTSGHPVSFIPSQSASPAAVADGGKFRRDPGVAASGEAYSTEGVISSGGAHYLPADGLSMMAGTSRIIDFAQRLRRVSIADTDVADLQVVNPFQLNLIAHKPGFTTLAVWNDQGHYEERQVRVDPGGRQQVMLHCVVAQLDRGNIEDHGLNLVAALQNTGLTLVSLPGSVATPFNVSNSPRVPIYAQSPNGPTSSLQPGIMPQGGSPLPLLLSQNLTYAIATQTGQWATQAFFQELENHNLAKILAQPNLLANSGEKAKFLSGGEIPIVVAQALNTSIVFKEFGTKVVFLPTVVGIRDVELLVQPEVSEPDYLHGVQLFGFNVPAFVTRRAETVARLTDGQTLIIAGLILHDKRETIQKVPYLGDIPFAGELFRTTDYQNTTTDLVMSVTPEIVRPLPSGGQVFTPTSRPPLTREEIRTGPVSTPDAARPRF